MGALNLSFKCGSCGNEELRMKVETGRLGERVFRVRDTSSRTVPERMVIEPAFNFHGLYKPYRASVLIRSKVFDFVQSCVLKNGSRFHLP